MNGAGGNFATCDMTQERVDGGGYDTPLVVPIMDDEAQVTDQAVQALEVGQRDAVFAFYVGSGNVELRARQMGVAVSTLYARLDLAHKRLQIWLAERAQMQREQRARMDRLQASARPAAAVDIRPLKVIKAEQRKRGKE